MKTTRARAATLLISLVLLSLILGSLSSGLAAPLSEILQRVPTALSPAKTTQVGLIETGTIVVNASLNAEGPAGLAGLRALPVQNATVKILQDVLGSFPLTLETNSSGMAESQLVVGNYTVTVSDRLFSTLAEVRIYPNVTTEAYVTTSRLSDQAAFGDLSDEDSSGSVAPWQSIVLAVNASSAITNSSEYFLDLSYRQVLATGVLEFHDEVVPVTIVASQISGSGSSSLLWLTVRPASFVPLQGAAVFTLVTYRTITRIIFNGL